MEEAEAVLARTVRIGPVASDTQIVRAMPLGVRLQVHGKAFTIGGRRLRLNGVTYGPFAPNAAGAAKCRRPAITAIVINALVIRISILLAGHHSYSV